MLKLVLVVTLLLLAVAPVSTGTRHISLTRESALADEHVTPKAPESGAPDATTTQDTGEQLDAPISYFPFVIVPPQQSKPKKVLLGPDYPVSVSFPSLGTSNKVERVGVNTKNEMEVPSGDTNDVGWFKDGTIPGEDGSAVIDAHVFAAFKKLRYLKIGQAVTVVLASGKKRTFQVIDSRVYALADVPLDYLFNRDDGKYLNLITCAGKLTPDHSTYDHRLIVYAKLVE